MGRLYLEFRARVFGVEVERADAPAVFSDKLVAFEEPQEPQTERAFHPERFGLRDHLDAHVARFVHRDLAGPSTDPRGAENSALHRPTYSSVGENQRLAVGKKSSGFGAMAP